MDILIQHFYDLTVGSEEQILELFSVIVEIKTVSGILKLALISLDVVDFRDKGKWIINSVCIVV